MKEKKENGLLSLEASISLTLFIFLMLFMYSFFAFFEVRNQMAHTLLATADSLSLDTYEAQVLGNSGNIAQLIYGIYGGVHGNSDGFYSTEQWKQIAKGSIDGSTWDSTIYAGQPPADQEQDEYGKVSAGSELLAYTIKDRFEAYLTSGYGSAEDILKKLHVVGGLDGIDFSKSHISSGKLTLVIRYKIELEFNVFGLGEYEIEQSCCSKLW